MATGDRRYLASTSGRPHIPRPYFAHFDHDPAGGNINLFLGTRGRGAWRLTFKKVLMPEIQVPAPPDFKPSCLGDTEQGILKVCNTGAGISSSHRLRRQIRNLPLSRPPADSR